LLSAAIVQERAGIAFRAAGAGKPFPEKAPFAAGILPGIDAAVTGHPARVARSERVLRREAVHDLDGETDHAIAALFPPLLRCQAPNGAIAGAPPPGGQGQPDYWFFWQRDAGQVAIALAGLLRTQYPFRESARALLDGYVRFVGGLPNRPGVRLEDLGVSRFTMEGEPIRTYGSPQNDGPAHTVLALATVLGEDAFDAGKPYLEYLSRYPLGPCFDPWEFAVADVFFDLNLARRALRVGARLARHAGEHAAADRYRARADELQRELEAFLAPDEGYIRAGRNCLQPLFRPVSHLDISVIGSVLTAYDVADPVLNVDEPLVIGTLRALERMSAERWPVNIAWKGSGHAGMGMGRFPEDMNDGIGVSGGNPWTFATLWAAQFYLRTIERLRLTGASGAETAVPAELLERADGYLRFVLSHMPASALTEQIDGETGAPRGARQLAWAHAAAIDTLLLRRKVAAGSPRRQQSR
jgi:glucoamylase